jgi:cyclopropane-fatty-acyl-phospholipid synthase
MLTRVLLDRILQRFIVHGTFRVVWPDGSASVYGAGAPVACAAFTRPAAIRRILTDPTLAFGELVTDGGIEPRGCTIYDVLDLLGVNLRDGAARVPGIALAARVGRLRRRLDQYNPAARSRRNVAHHYDLDGRLYRNFLDADMNYSCAYFPTGTESLEAAQAAKKAHIAAKLKLDRPGLTVLDIGSGWGGLALTLARDFGAAVTGITLSREQLDFARARAGAEGLADRVVFRLQDYRALGEAGFDRVVSVGMFEHVGVSHYGAYFRAVRRALAPDGVGLLHTIGRSDGPFSTNRWMAKYIFPGGYAPALSEVLPALERSGLVATDIEVLRRHYAETLRAWRRNFLERRGAVEALYDARFCRMWEFYLSVSEMAFRRLCHVNFQIQFGRDQAAAPLTRGYLAAAGRP